MRKYYIFALAAMCLSTAISQASYAADIPTSQSGIPIAVNSSKTVTDTVEGLQLSAVLDKRTYRAGSPVYLLAELKNCSPKSITMLFPYVNSAAALNVIVETADYKQAPPTARAVYVKPDFTKPYLPDSITSLRHSLSPGATYNFVLQPNIAYDMTQTSDYFVIVKIMIPRLDGQGTAVLETKPMLLSVTNPVFERSAPFPDNPQGEE